MSRLLSFAVLVALSVISLAILALQVWGTGALCWVGGC